MMKQEEIRRIANEKAAKCITDADPVFIGVRRADEIVEGLSGRKILHAGPPVAYEDMCELHRRGMISACRMEGWAEDEKEADRLLKSGKVELDAAFNTNTVGSGTGILTPSVPVLVVKDRNNGKTAGVFPHEGRFGGGFCGWGLFSEEIRQNLIWMRDTLFPPLNHQLEECGGIHLKPIIAQSLKMGDENHSSQTAVDALFLREIIPLALKCENKAELLTYFAGTKRFFHNFGQTASRAALLGAVGIQNSTMVTAAGGNGVEYGIQIAGAPGEWFTAPSPMIEGTYMTPGSKREDQLPWLGDSSIVECAGLGGILSAASPEVCRYRHETLADGIRTTNEMRRICVMENASYEIPTLDFAHPPVGIDAEKVVNTGILPVIDGGMLNRQGGWMGAGCARIPKECFEKAMQWVRKNG